VKKALLFAVLVFYTLSSMGVSLNYFYCCGKLKSITVKVNTEDQGKCHKKDHKRCCDHVTVDLKLNVDQLQTDVHSLTHYDLSVPVLLYSGDPFSLNESNNRNLNLLYKEPHYKSKYALYILNRVFRI